MEGPKTERSVNELLRALDTMHKSIVTRAGNAMNLRQSLYDGLL